MTPGCLNSLISPFRASKAKCLTDPAVQTSCCSNNDNLGINNLMTTDSKVDNNNTDMETKRPLRA